MSVIEFEILGEPMGKERPRACVLKGHAHIYTPSKTAQYEEEVKVAYLRACKKDVESIVPTTEPLIVMITANFGLNKDDYTLKGAITKKGKKKLNGIIKHTKRPDCDNVGKIVLDALQGLAFVNDSQVVSLIVRKRYSTTPKVSVLISY